MTRPIPSGKQSVKLAPDGARVSRIRRDPPPAVKQKLVLEPGERDQWVVVTGVLAFALAVVTILFAFASYTGWSPQAYTVEIKAEE